MVNKKCGFLPEAVGLDHAWPDTTMLFTGACTTCAHYGLPCQAAGGYQVVDAAQSDVAGEEEERQLPLKEERTDS